MNVSEYAAQVVSRFITDITDHVFLAIERDDEAMREYMCKVNEFGLAPINTTIGRKVKEMLNLENIDESDKPKSRIIQTYTRHSITRT
ncbi:MAG: hypothetical protein LBH20_09750 [Treponema sp.]|jgi:spore maturation protein SpmA|nr:hypothetical protein [Treponema sp.]